MCRKKYKLIIVILAAFMVLASAAGYFAFVSSMVYEESSSHLKEIYAQSKKAFRGIVLDKWKNLDDWMPYIEHARGEEEMLQYIGDRQKQWGFTDFYFISWDGDYITSEGEKGYISLGNRLPDLMRDKENIVASAAVPGAPELMLFAVPSFKGEFGGFEYVVPGIGINVYEPEGGFPDKILGVAGAVLKERAFDTRNRIIAGVAERFMKYYSNLNSGSYFESYEKRLMWKGRKINVISPSGTVPAILKGVDRDCRLIVEYENGETGLVSSGEISIRLK